MAGLEETVDQLEIDLTELKVDIKALLVELKVLIAREQNPLAQSALVSQPIPSTMKHDLEDGELLAVLQDDLVGHPN